MPDASSAAISWSFARTELALRRRLLHSALALPLHELLPQDDQLASQADQLVSHAAPSLLADEHASEAAGGQSRDDEGEADECEAEGRRGRFSHGSSGVLGHHRPNDFATMILKFHHRFGEIPNTNVSNNELHLRVVVAGSSKKSVQGADGEQSARLIVPISSLAFRSAYWRRPPATQLRGCRSA